MEPEAGILVLIGQMSIAPELRLQERDCGALCKGDADYHSKSKSLRTSM
jgi:hypothetical protein